MDYTERQALRNRKVTMPFSCNVTLAEVLDRYADAQGWSMNQALAELVRAGLKVKANEANEKKNTP